MAEVKETAQVFGRNRNLLGIITEPAGGARPGPAVILLNAGIIHRVGPSRVSVEVARALAAAGYRALRFDLSGIGDSPAAPGVASLGEVVRGDIADAISLMTKSAADGAGVVLFGICAGADNAFYLASEDERVKGLVLVDPSVYRTTMYRIRNTWKRIRSARSWWNALSGRSLYKRLRRYSNPRGGVVRPPGFYGLLTLDQETATARAREMSSRGVRFLYIITRDMHPVCNYPGQISDAFGGAIDKHLLRVEWRPKADHLLREEADRKWLGETIGSWMNGGL